MKTFLPRVAIAALLFAVVCSPSLFAQRYTITPSKEVDGIWGGLDDLELIVRFLNTTEEQFDTKWMLGMNTMPTKWDPAMCDNKLCLAFNQLEGIEQTMTIAPKSQPVFMQGMLKLSVKPMDYDGNVYAGAGKVEVMIRDVQTPGIIDTIIFTAKAEANSALESHENIGIEVNPNPAGDFLTVKTSAASGSIAIVSSLGIVEYEASLDGGSGYSLIHLGGIPQGVHFLLVTDASGGKTMQKFIRR